MPSNPYLRIADVPEVAQRLRGRGGKEHRGVKLLVDATFATPVNARPLELGADLVLHSGTKYLGGHNDVLAGGVAGSASLVSLVRDMRGVLGGVLDAHAAYMVERGMRTLHLRVRRQNETASLLAARFESHSSIERMFYPGLASHPDHLVAKRLLTGFGGVVTFVVKGGLAGGTRFVDALRIATIAPSLGGVETLVEQPALMSFYELTTEERAGIGIPDGLVRLSVGIEDPDDLVRDVAQALEKV
jgi:cystathionine gamma-synthase